MKNKLLIIIPLLFAALTSVGCSTEYYHPKAGGEVDTLHNEVHVTSYDVLVKGGFEYEKDESKTYITDDDGLKYKWDNEKQEYYCITEKDTTFNFYFDNTHTTDENGNDCPILTVKWYMLKPLGACPEEIDKVEEVLALGAERGFSTLYDFDQFLGFSFYSTCLGDSAHMWNFKKDYKQQAVTNLYGIWVD